MKARQTTCSHRLMCRSALLLRNFHILRSNCLRSTKKCFNSYQTFSFPHDLVGGWVGGVAGHETGHETI